MTSDWQRGVSPAQRRQLKRIHDGQQPRSGQEIRSARALVDKAMAEVVAGKYQLTAFGLDVWGKGRK